MKINLNRKDIKSNSGITLIALVLTIIVLLILAGVAISQITGNSSILNKAQSASDKTRQAEELSNVQLAVVNAMAENSKNLGALTADGIEGQLVKFGITNTLTENTDTNDGWKLTGNEGTYTISSKGKVEQTSVFSGGTTPTAVATATATPTETPTPTPTQDPTAGITMTTQNRTLSGATTEYGAKNPIIPKGFRPVNTSGASWTYTDSTKTEVTGWNNGLVITDDAQGRENYGNEFVWIPVDNPTNTTYSYARTWFTGYSSFSNYSESLNSTESNSVGTYKGYYIGRYEAGVSGTTFRTSATDATVLVKKGCAPYNYITRTNAETKAGGMYTGNTNYGVTSRLCSSYAWDTAINFIQSHSSYSSYGTNSPQGIYGVSSPALTGQSTAVCNLYDMGGNVWEWTTESYSGSSNPYAIRGGSYYSSSSDTPAGYRNYDFDYAYDVNGFRVTLYL